MTILYLSALSDTVSLLFLFGQSSFFSMYGYGSNVKIWTADFSYFFHSHWPFCKLTQLKTSKVMRGIRSSASCEQWQTVPLKSLCLIFPFWRSEYVIPRLKNDFKYGFV